MVIPEAAQRLSGTQTKIELCLWIPALAADFVRWCSAGMTKMPYASGGGRNTISCLAESATTSGGFCSFMLWIAQNRS